jgi:hypothetical protein
MSAILHILVWEWINIALECTATIGVRLPRFPLAVAGVNLVTHPMLMLLLSIWGREPRVVLPLEAAVVVAEWAMLCALYRGRAEEVPLPRASRPRPDNARPTGRFLFAVSLLMNATSYGTGLLLDFTSH